MPGGRGTPHAGFRINPQLWDRFGEAVEAAGTERTAVLKALIRWYLGLGELPARPVDVEQDEG